MNKTRKIAYTGLMTALVLVATYSVRIPIPFTNGYIHLGDCMVFLAPLLLGWKYGALAAGAGSMLADVLGGYFHWAIPTLVIKTIMALIVGAALLLKGKASKTVFTIAMAAVWIAFIAGVKSFLRNNIANNAQSLAEEVESVDSISELEGLANIVQTELSLSAIILLIVVFCVAVFINKRGEGVNVSFLMGAVGSGLWMVIGYFGAAYLMYGSAGPVFGIPMNLIQFTAGLILAASVTIPLKKHLAHLRQNFE